MSSSMLFLATGRTDNEVKNYWNSHIRRKLITMGIDPNNHRLNQTISHHKNDPGKSDQLQASPIIKSSSTATIVALKPNPDHDDEQSSDAATGLDDGTTNHINERWAMVAARKQR